MRRAQLIEAGLELLGTDSTLSVVAVIAQSGLAPRYFYDEFSSLDALQLAVFDSLVEEAERRALRALERVGMDQKARVRTRAVLDEMLAFIFDDPRRGHVLLIASVGSPILGPRRERELRRLAELMAFHALGSTKSTPRPRPATVSATFAMGGFAEVVASALQNPATINPEQIADDLTALFVECSRVATRLKP